MEIILVERMNRAKELERAVERTLHAFSLKFLRIENYRCFRCGQVQNSKAKGFPDFYVYYPFQLAIEVKTGKGKLTKEQKQVKVHMELAGVKYLVVRDTIDDLLKILELLTMGEQ